MPAQPATSNVIQFPHPSPSTKPEDPFLQDPTGGRVAPCTSGAANSATKKRRKSLSRRLTGTEGQQEVRQRGHVYQKSRGEWIPTERAYGRYRIDVPGQSKQKEVRVALGFCRDELSAMLKLQTIMRDAGVFDAVKIPERILPVTTFAQQAAWMISEMAAGRIVHTKTREPIGERTIEFYQAATAYLVQVVGDKPLASLGNLEARDLMARMKTETNAKGAKRFGRSNKTLSDYFGVFERVIASAVDDEGNRVYPRNWNLAFIGLPKVDKKKQHRPTLTASEMTQLVANAKGRYQMGAVLLAGSSVRISELLALRIEKHISDDRKTLYIRQQRRKNGKGVSDVLKTPASNRDIDLHSSLAKMLDDFIGDRKSGFLIETENSTMLSPENFFRDGLKTVFKNMGRTRVRFHAFRRFREAKLLESDCRDILIDYWMGHENDSMSMRYGKQLVEDVKFRKEWAERVGLGFDLPTQTEKALIGIRGIQNGEKAVAA